MSPVVASLTKNRRTTLERVEKFLSKDYFVDVNLFGRLYPQKMDISSILHWDASSSAKFPPPNAGDLPGDTASISSSEFTGEPAWKVKVPGKDHFQPYKLGDPSFGPTWSTHWFIVNIEIPVAWLAKEVHLIWDTG